MIYHAYFYILFYNLALVSEKNGLEDECWSQKL